MCLRAVEEPPVFSVLQQQIGVDEEDGGIVKASAVLLQYSSSFICFAVFVCVSVCECVCALIFCPRVSVCIPLCALCMFSCAHKLFFGALMRHLLKFITQERSLKWRFHIPFQRK